MSENTKKKLLDILEKKADKNELDFTPEQFFKVCTWIQIALAQDLTDANVDELTLDFDFTRNDQQYKSTVTINIDKI